MLYLDTETTGLMERAGFKKYYDPLFFPEKYPHSVTEICYVLDDNEPVHMLVYPAKYPVPINTDGYVYPLIDDALSNGIELKKALDDLCMLDFHTIVGHNISFDIAMLMSDAAHIKHTGFTEKIKTVNLVDTSEMGKNVCKIMISSKFGGRGITKAPTLMELYVHIFKEKFEHAHNSLYDTIATKKCYEAMSQKDEIKVNHHQWSDYVARHPKIKIKT